MADALAQLQQRVANGITWLDEHDPGSVMHLWYEAGLTPLSRMPAQTEERRAEYSTYYAARQTYERLSRELEKVDPQWAAAPTSTTGAQWHPSKKER